MPRSDRLRLHVESLESRETPTANWVTESFAGPGPALPAHWRQWSQSSGETFIVSPTRPQSSSAGLLSTGSSLQGGQTWLETQLAANTAASVAVALDSLQPIHLFVRGSHLDGSTPTYYALSITRGLEAQLLRVVNGQTTVLSSLRSTGYVSGPWVRLTLQAEGTLLTARIQRLDTGEFLNVQGDWQSSTTDALRVTDAAIPTAGHSGLARPAVYSATVALDEFAVTTTTVTASVETFQSTPTGQLPNGWKRWISPGASFAAGPRGNQQALLATAGASSQAARVWIDSSLPADGAAAASILLDSLNPAQVFVRGSGLNTTSPSYYAVSITRGMEVQLVKVVNGRETILVSLSSVGYFSGQWVRVQIDARGQTLTAQVQRTDTGEFLNAQGRWQSAAVAALSAVDAALSQGGAAGLARPARYTGTVVFDDFQTNQVSPISAPTSSRNIPRHLSHIRLAMLAYSGWPQDALANRLLRDVVDLVVPNTAFLSAINTVAPNTPQLIYSNVTNLYRETLLDWLAFADRTGLSREAAFYHVAAPTAFQGTSPSSQPVNWFWNVVRRSGTAWTNLTAAARNVTTADVALSGKAGDWLAIGYPERYRELNVTMTTAAALGWTGVIEYASAIDGQGRVTQWKTLPLRTNGTAAWTRSGQITFDPPADWVAGSFQSNDSLFYIRVRTTSNGTAPVLSRLLGRDYVGANGGNTGTIPVFDSQADVNGDGYLDDAEYANRLAGHDARFVYESRLFYASYGQMRFAVQPTPEARMWANDYHRRLMEMNSLADGVFLDNSVGRSPTLGITTVESAEDYTQQMADLVAALAQELDPRWVLTNTSGGYLASDVIAAVAGISMEEFAIRGLAHTSAQFDMLAELVARRMAEPNGYFILDASPAGGSVTDARTQIATLAEYYLVADPERTFLMPFGGFEPSTNWSRHWFEAIAFDVGRPLGSHNVFAAGWDPAQTNLRYTVYGREYANALVLYKPLSYMQAQPPGTTADATATTHALNGSYRSLRADGTLGPVVTSITLRNGEGAILVKA